MVIERRILVSLLRMTRQGPVRRELIRKDSRVPTPVVNGILEKLRQDGFCQQRRGVVEATPTQRVKVAVRAVQLGADFEQACSFLHWKEFEDLASEAFRANNYSVTSNLHFRHAGKRWEIDLLACNKPLIVCVDCKHWHHGWCRAAIVKTVEMQIKRTEALSAAFPSVCEKKGLAAWEQAVFIPAVLSLTPSPLKFHDKVPVVPILQLRNFLNELPAHTLLLTHFKTKIKSEIHKLTEYAQ